MRFDWRAISGPVLTIATTAIAIAVDRQFVVVPSPASLFICIVAAWIYFAGSSPPPTSSAFIVPSQSVRW